jgi:hypothetical protein
MERLKKRDILQRLLTEHGYLGWYVIEPNQFYPAGCLLFNPKEKKVGEIAIPDEWLADPGQTTAIGELLESTIQNCAYVLPQAQQSSVERKTRGMWNSSRQGRGR